MAWGVDDVDLDVLIADADILGEDGDPTLTLEVIVIEVRIYFGSLSSLKSLPAKSILSTSVVLPWST